jgi:hypothetical protein
MPLPDAPFVHHVYFWLKDPADTAARDAIVAGLTALTAAPDILWSHIGVPAAAERGVVDASYAVSWLVFFADKAAQDRYQVDPIHLTFVETCATYWDRVIVYDSEHVAPG